MGESTLGEVTKKRKQLTLNEKLTFLERVDTGKKVTAVAREFGISNSTACGIVKERTKIRTSYEQYKLNGNRKRVRLSLYTDIDEAVYMWFKQMRAKNAPVNGPLIQQKAREFGHLLGHPHFEGSSGWLSRFRDRHDMSIESMRGPENSAYDMSYIGMTDDEIVSCITQKTSNCNKQESEFIVAEVDVTELRDSENPVNGTFSNNTELANGKSTNEDIVSCITQKSLNCNKQESEFIVSDVNVSELKDSDTSFYNPYTGEQIANSDFLSSNELVRDQSACESTYEVNLSQIICETSLSPIKLTEAVSLVQNLTCFLKQQNDIPKNIWDSLESINKFITRDLAERLKQRKITDFFGKLSGN